MTERRGVAALGVCGLFAALAVLMTWPQVLHLATRATPHQDVYFNMWRLHWFAHALATPSAHIFDANIFYPERGTLALSDAMFVEGVVAAPLVWAGLAPVLVHNIMLLGAIALSGAAMFALVRYLTGSAGAGLLAGIIFAFAPYRFEHIMHMELQWSVWMPLAFLALHRTCDTGRWRYGLATGACLALQMLSSIYYGIFLATLIGIAAPLLMIRDRQVPVAKIMKPLAAGALLAAIVCLFYALPYRSAHQRVGDRPPGEVAMFSARGNSYLSATPGNWLYGASARGGPERHLFPGATAVVLAMVGVLLRVPSRRAIVYLLLLVAAFETSLGFRGYSYSFLYEHVYIYRGLRASARLGIFVLLFLGILAGYGYEALAGSWQGRARRLLLGACVVALLLEYRTTVELTGYPNNPPPIYRMLARQPRGVVAEFPVPIVNRLPGDDAAYSYMSIFHWFPLVNGYSGFYPGSYLARLERLQSFPGQASIIQLRRDGVQYVIVHGSAYEPDSLARVRERIDRDANLVDLGSFDDADGHAYLYRLR